jgi:hypothetical protein
VVRPTPVEALRLPLVLGMTACLLASSVTIHLAERTLGQGNQGGFLLFWAATIVLGVLFLLSTAYEWHGLINDHGLTIGRNLFGTTYYTLVGLHALDAATEEYVANAQVTVRLRARGTGRVLEYSATTQAATNKLLRAAEFQLPEPGWWDMAVAVEGPHGPALLRFEVQADEPPHRWLDIWPWFGWPALVVALFGLHRALVRRKPLCSKY